MLEKTMKSVIKKKINEWKESISDEEVVKAIDKDLIITGGCFTSMIHNETPNDFDVYFKTKETVLKVAEYYANRWNNLHRKQQNNINYHTKVFVLDGAKPSREILDYFNINDPSESRSRMISNITPDRVKMIFPSDGITGDPEEANNTEELGLKDEEKRDVLPKPEEMVEELDETSAEDAEEAVPGNNYDPVFISTNAITLRGGIQIVVRFHGEPSDIHDTYDFEHTKAYFDWGKNYLEIPKKVYELTINKTLQYTGSKYPVCSIFRIRKFVNRGWTINAGQMLKICMQISELDLSDIDTLEDQLVGVDSLYFMSLIEKFRLVKEHNPNFVLTSDYVMSVVDKIF